MKAVTKLWILVLVLMALAPLGLLLSAWFGAGGAWGEWGAREIGVRVGYVPHGLARLADVWHAPLPDYALSQQGAPRLRGQSLEYFVAALAGVAAVAVCAYLWGRSLVRRERRR